MFDKKEYWNRRRSDERGQNSVLVVFYEKGKEVPSEDDKKFLNGLGEHLVRVRGKGLQHLNRVESRRASRSHPATKKNYQHQKENGFSHTVNRPNYSISLPTKAVYTTNHVRHRENQVAKEIVKNRGESNEV